MSRAVDEWVGRTPDSAIPKRVRDRVFLRHNGICHVSGRKIAAGEPWQLDHVTALINGGEHKESNLAPILVDKHKDKTAQDVAVKAKTAAIRQRHLGITRSKQKIPTRIVAKEPKPEKLPAFGLSEIARRFLSPRAALSKETGER